MKRWLFPGAIALLVLVYPVLVDGLPVYQRLGALVLLAAIGASAWNIVGGYAGQVSVGHAVFFGFGAYVFGLLMQSGGFSIPVATVVTLAATAVQEGNGVNWPPQAPAQAPGAEPAPTKWLMQWCHGAPGIVKAIEEKRFLPVGADREVASDFQLIAGTNRDLGLEERALEAVVVAGGHLGGVVGFGDEGGAVALVHEVAFAVVGEDAEVREQAVVNAGVGLERGARR